jgi:serine/threonine-protein kinase
LEDKYEIQGVLGTGAMGSVVRAYHLLRKAPVALKFMSPEIIGQNDVIERFLNEGVAASKIDSEHVVKVYDVSKLPSGVPYMVMEFLEGQDLSALLAREGKPYLTEVARAVHLILQILRGLQVAHRAKIIHRDMKPANCFVIGKEDDPDFIKIVDFGISKLRQDDDDEGVALTHAGAALGTPLYMSLEQARSPRDVDARTDLYSTAVILYELLSGKPPFVPESGTLSELFTMLALEHPKPLTEVRDDLPEGLWEVVLQGLDKNPEKRFQTAGRMAEALVPFSDERSDYVVSKMLRSTATGVRSRIPPPMTTRSAGVASTAGSGTVMMGPTPGGRVAPTMDEAPAGMLAVGASTTQGTTQNATVRPPGGTPFAFAVAVVAVGAVAVAGWMLGRAKTPESTSATNANTSMVVVVDSGGPDPDPAPAIPSASASAEAPAPQPPGPKPPLPPTKVLPPPPGPTPPPGSAKDPKHLNPDG